VTLLAGLVGVAAIAVAIGAGTGRLDVPPPPGVHTDLAGIATSDAGTAGDLVVWIANGSGDEAMTAEVARLARVVGIHGFEVADDAAPAAETRIVVHSDTPDVVAAAADLRDLIGTGVVERVAATDHGADLSVVLGADARDPA
jgi:hypothetical protein